MRPHVATEQTAQLKLQSAHTYQPGVTQYGAVCMPRLQAAGGCAYASCWPHLVPPSRRRELLGPDAERLLADAPKPPPLRAATAGAAPALGWGSGSLPGLLGGGSGGGGFGSLLAAAAAAAAAAAEAAPVGGGGGGGVGAAAAAVDSDDSDDDFSDLDQIGWRPQPGLKWEG